MEISKFLGRLRARGYFIPKGQTILGRYMQTVRDLRTLMQALFMNHSSSSISRDRGILFMIDRRFLPQNFDGVFGCGRADSMEGIKVKIIISANFESGLGAVGRGWSWIGQRLLGV